jgi:hypothetical protein
MVGFQPVEPPTWHAVDRNLSLFGKPQNFTQTALLFYALSDFELEWLATPLDDEIAEKAISHDGETEMAVQATVEFLAGVSGNR